MPSFCHHWCPRLSFYLTNRPLCIESPVLDSSVLPIKQGSNHTPVLPATWDGLKEFRHSATICRLSTPSWTISPSSHLNRSSTSKNNWLQVHPSREWSSWDPLCMNYDKFLSLPKPQKELEAWCLLYCKLRIFEMFSGDRVTQRGERGEGVQLFELR